MNCHIELPWRMIPEQYQGLDMPNFALIPLASKLSYLQCNWGFGAPHSNALMIGYESFIIEVGLYGDTMGYKYKGEIGKIYTYGGWRRSETTPYF